MLNSGLLKAKGRFQNWMQNQALPLWVEQGMHDGYVHYERLLANGEPDRECNVRVRVQARQAFAYAVAFDRGWAPQGQILATKLYDFLEASARHPSSEDGYVHLLNSEFEVIDTKQDLYDHAFFLLAFAWLYKTTGRAEYIQRANTLLNWLDQRFSSLVGGWYEGDYEAACRCQNPHMHLFEAFMSLYETSGEQHWLARASEIFSLFQSRFFDAEQSVLLEFFDSNWCPLAGERGGIIEPGHMLEWVWLLRWYERLSGHDTSPWADVLYSKAYALGQANSGLFYDEVNLDGSLRGGTKRSWPMTEVIKANIAQARAGDKRCEAKAAEAIDLLFKYYLDAPVAGSWVDQRGAEDEVINDVAPASTLYHLIVACTEVVDYCDEVLAADALSGDGSRLSA